MNKASSFYLQTKTVCKYATVLFEINSVRIERRYNFSTEKPFCLPNFASFQSDTLRHIKYPTTATLCIHPIHRETVRNRFDISSDVAGKRSENVTDSVRFANLNR